MATTKARVEELEAVVDGIQGRVDRLWDELDRFEKQKGTLPCRYGVQVRKYIDEEVEKEVAEKTHANLMALITFISSIADIKKGKK
jgi:hypothetical protein